MVYSNKYYSFNCNNCLRPAHADKVDWQALRQTDLALFMPPAKPQAFQYDLNGNLTNDGYRAYTWDGENRLTAIEMAAEAVSDGLPAQRSEFVYDGQGRRLFRTDLLEWDGSAYAITNQTRSVWDGMAILAEVKTTVDGVSTNYHVWGLDLSQTLNGAGGVGGLLAVISPLPVGEGQGEVGMAIPSYDGNGNVTTLLDDNGTVTARYEYTPFGQLFASSGPAAHDNPWRFSTKPYDDLWNLVFYEYRVYSPDLQIWLSRDPVCTITGYNLVLFLNNDSINSYDLFGLVEYCCSQHDIDIQAQSASHVVVRMTEKTIRYPEKDLPMHPEFGVYLCCSKDNVVYMAGLPTEGEIGMEEGGGWIAYLDFTKLRKCHDDDKVVAIVHSHPSGKNFSKADLLNPCIYMQAVGTTILWRHCDGQTCSKDLAQKDAQWECIGK